MILIVADAMKPITFKCVELFRQPSQEIAAQILDLEKWSEFKGYGPMPGIESAEFELKTEEIVGSRFRVTNTDGSSHVEEIREWDPARRVHLHFQDFSPPLSKLATGFDEVFEFEQADGCTKVTRSFAMHPRSLLTKPLLWLISLLVRRAIAAHLRQMRAQSED